MMFEDLGDEREALAGSVGRTDPFEDLVKFAVKLAQTFDRFLVCGGKGEGGGGGKRWRRGRMRRRNKADEENKGCAMRKRGATRKRAEEKIIGVAVVNVIVIAIVIAVVIPDVDVVSSLELKRN